MDYTEWSSLKNGDRVKGIYGKGTIISSVGIGHVVEFDNGETVKITDGSLEKIKSDEWIVVIKGEGYYTGSKYNTVEGTYPAFTNDLVKAKKYTSYKRALNAIDGIKKYNVRYSYEVKRYSECTMIF